MFGASFRVASGLVSVSLLWTLFCYCSGMSLLLLAAPLELLGEACECESESE